MSKLKSRIIGAIVIIAIVAYVVVIPQINAVETKVTEEQLTCKDLSERYGLYIDKGEADRDYVVVKDSAKACGTDDDKSKTSFKIISVNGVDKSNAELILTEDNKKITIQADLIQEGKKHYITVTLQNTNKATETITIDYTLEVEDAVIDNVNEENVFYNTICASYRATAAGYGTEGEKFFKQSLPYCWQTYSSSSYTAEELNNRISKVTSLWNTYQQQNSNLSADFNDVFNYIKNKANSKASTNVINDPDTKTLSVKCSNNRVQTGIDDLKTYTNEYGETIPSTEYYLNREYYYAKEEITQDDEENKVTYTYNYAPGNAVKETHKACKTTCEESVKLEYGPPVASKAGLCFEYKVKVTSYVKCNAEIIAPEPKTYTNYCNPSPICYSPSGVLRNLEQAGPNEDFDRCIQSCDGGKYTESCSLKCYNQVYGKNVKKLALDYENGKVEKLATGKTTYTLSQCLKDNQSYYGCYLYSNDSINWYSLKNYNLDGSSKGKIAWNDKLALGRWYIDRVYKKSNGKYEESNPNYVRNGSKGYDISGITSSCTTGYCGTYISDEMGIYRANYDGALCNDTCYWSKNACSKDSYLNPGSLKKDAKANQAAYDAAADACISSATCSEKVGEFTISIKYDTKKDKTITVHKINYPLTSEPQKLKADGKEKEFENSSIILSHGGCYKENDGSNKYMTEWSFPGTYIHTKKNQISYEPKENGSWYKEKNKFCLVSNAESVNSAWYKWYNGDGPLVEPQAQEGTSNGYNIEAIAKNFGRLGWNFNSKCFYALPDDGVDCEDCGKMTDYTIRTVDTDNLFPNSNNPGSTSEYEREIGFNWSDAAEITEFKNLSYRVRPSQLIEQIQSNSATLYDDSNLEYQFHLTPSTLRKIQKYNSEYQYGDFGGKTSLQGGVMAYTSNLFRSGTAEDGVRSDIKITEALIKDNAKLGINNTKLGG